MAQKFRIYLIRLNFRKWKHWWVDVLVYQRKSEWQKFHQKKNVFSLYSAMIIFGLNKNFCFWISNLTWFWSLQAKVNGLLIIVRKWTSGQRVDSYLHHCGLSRIFKVNGHQRFVWIFKRLSKTNTQHPTKKCHQYRNSVTNTRQMLPTPENCHQHLGRPIFQTLTLWLCFGIGIHGPSGNL